MYKAIIDKLNQILAKANKDKFHAVEFSDQNFKDGEIKALEDALDIIESLQRAEFKFVWHGDPRTPGLLHCNRNGGVYVGSIKDIGDGFKEYSIRLLDRDSEALMSVDDIERLKRYVERKHTELFNRIQAYLNGED